MGPAVLLVQGGDVVQCAGADLGALPRPVRELLQEFAADQVTDDECVAGGGHRCWTVDVDGVCHDLWCTPYPAGLRVALLSPRNSESG